MCGIAGIYHCSSYSPVEQLALKRMVNVIRHRGPDDEGYYINENIGLGHCRLAIIDLSEAGHQPMSNENGTIRISYNGEIYNYLELGQDLKSKGHIFRSKTDTEVIIHAYEEWGINCLQKFNGMFAFAIWDGNKKKLFVARDRLGIKPLYYYFDGKRFIFASEIKAILEDKSIERKPYYPAISQYLRYMYTVDDSTFFKGIKKLLPGYYLMLEDGHFSISQYWDLMFNEDGGRSEDYYVEKLLDLLKDSVRIHLRSDVPLGSHLSGGLDSSLLVGLASCMLPHPLKTFSGAFAEGGVFDERKYIRMVAAKFQTDHYEIVPTAQDYADALPKMVWYMDEPTIGSAVICHYYLCKLASEQVKVVLGGQGGDELFGGYYRYLPAYLTRCLGRFFSCKLSPLEIARTGANFLSHISNIGFRNMLQKIRRRKGMLNVVTDDFRELSQKPSFRERSACIRTDDDPLNSMFYWDIKCYLPGLLHLEDRTSMAVSIESRVPFLDHRIVEFAAAIPPDIKLKELRLKHIEREVARKFLPQEIVDRKDKQGFYPPTPLWFKRELLPMIQDILFSLTFRERGIFDVPVLESKMQDYITGKIDYSEQIWMMLNVELWHQQFIDVPAHHYHP